MGRFDWLETGKPAPALTPEEAGQPGLQFDAKGFFEQAEGMYRRGSYESALKFYGRALGEDAGLASAWLGQVNCLMELGEAEEAKVWASKALDQMPNDADLLAARAVLLAGRGEMKDALQVMDRAIARRSPSPYVWICRGRVILLGGSGSAAAGLVFRKALEAAPRDAHWNLRVGMAYLQGSDPVNARPHLQQAVDSDPSNPLAWYQMGLCHEGLYIYSRARDCFARAAGLKPDFKEDLEQAMARVARAGPLGRLWGILKGLWSGAE